MIAVVAVTVAVAVAVAVDVWHIDMYLSTAVAEGALLQFLEKLHTIFCSDFSANGFYQF